MTHTRTLLCGTRGSPLALAQTKIIQDVLFKTGIFCSTQIIQTIGDDIQDRPLSEVGGKNLFCSALNQALDNHQVDLVIHSLKDMEPESLSQWPTFFISPAAPLEDALIFKEPTSFKELISSPFTIGTSSPRRSAQIHCAFPKASTRPLRGNLQTRLSKLIQGECDAIILAKAGIERQDLTNFLKENKLTYQTLYLRDFLPSAGQGIIAVQCRKDDEECIRRLSPLNIEIVSLRANIEKDFLKILKGNCHTAVGVWADVQSNAITLCVDYHTPKNRYFIEESFVKEDSFDTMQRMINALPNLDK